MNDDADSRPQLRLHAYHPRLDVLVVGVDGELDLLTALCPSALWGSRSPPESVTCGDRQPCMIADVSLRLLYLIFGWLVRVRDASSG